MQHGTSRRAIWLQRIADQVAQNIAERIESGALAPGDSPGTREDLAGSFMTTPSVIDKALEDLTSDGRLTALADGGHVVSAPAPRQSRFEVPAAEKRDDIIAILELRLGVEAQAAALAAERHTDEQLAAIQAAATAYADCSEQEAAQADLRFHGAIAAASANRYVSDLLSYLGPLLIPRMRGGLPGSGPENKRRSVIEHARIVEAIAVRNGETARDEMRRHLNRALDLIRGTGG